MWGGTSLFLPPVFPEGSIRVFGDVRLGFDQISMLGVRIRTAYAAGPRGLGNVVSE